MSGNEHDTKSGIISSIFTKLSALKKSNPKVFFGGIGCLILLILIAMLGTEDKKPLPLTKLVNLVPGQTYKLRVVNSYDPDSTVRLVSIPGSMAAYDDTDADDRIGDCKHLPRDTKVKVLSLQTTAGIQYVNVEILEGKCSGERSWVTSSNLDNLSG